jgi:O-antigen ligase
MAVAVPLLAWISAEGSSRGGRALAAAGVPALALALYLTSSRGAVIGVAVALTIVVALSERPGRTLARCLPGLIAGAAVVAIAASRPSLAQSPGGSLGTDEAIALGALVIAALAAGAWRWRFEPAGLGRLGAVRLGRRAVIGVSVAAAVALVAVAALLGADRLLGGAAPASSAPTARGQLGADSGRSDFWGAAIDAFGSDPLRGVGAGNYENWWNQHGSLGVSVQNAHSAPLETLAELGIVGGLLLGGFGAVALWFGAREAWRDRRGGERAAALAVLVAVGLASAIDWTWEVPAAFAPGIVAAGLLLGRGLDRRDPAASAARSAPAKGWLLRAGLGATALAVLWAAGVLAVASDRMRASDDALERGDLASAAQAARSAAELEPWSAEPRLQLATIEQNAGNLRAAQREVELAIDSSPGDFRGWYLAARIAAQLDEPGAGPYLARAEILAPLVLDRAQAVR